MEDQIFDQNVIKKLYSEINYYVSSYGHKIVSFRNSTETNTTKLAQDFLQYLSQIKEGTMLNLRSVDINFSEIAYMSYELTLMIINNTNNLESIIKSIINNRNNGHPRSLYILSDPANILDYNNANKISIQAYTVDVDYIQKLSKVHE